MEAKLSAETIVGAGVVAAAAIFLAFAVATTGSKSFSAAGGYRLSAEFDSIEGINVGSDIRLAGIKVGTVIGQRLNPESYQAQLDLSINNSIVLSDDTTAKVTSEGLFGSRYVALEPGGSETKLAEGGVISFTQGSVDMWALISQAMFDRNAPKATSPEPAQPDQTAPQPEP